MPGSVYKWLYINAVFGVFVRRCRMMCTFLCVSCRRVGKGRGVEGGWRVKVPVVDEMSFLAGCCWRRVFVAGCFFWGRVDRYRGYVIVLTDRVVGVTIDGRWWCNVVIGVSIVEHGVR